MEYGTLVRCVRTYYMYIPGTDWKEFEKTTRFTGPSFRYRMDPVPGIHVWKNRVGDSFRNPKTMNEIRQFFACEIPVRGKRHPRMLPDAWDDIYCCGLSIRSWKRTKKRHQWDK